MCFDYPDERLSIVEPQHQTINGSRITQPSGFEITRVSDRNRVFILNIKGFTRRFIRNHKLRGLKK